MPNPPTVFISYRRELSVDLAQSIHGRLKSVGVDVFIDLDAIDVGEDYELRLERELDQRDCLLVILAPETLNRSTWVPREIASALRRGKKIIPVTTGGYTYSRQSLPPEIADLARYNYIPYEPLYADAAFDKIKRSLGLTNTNISSPTPAVGTRRASSAAEPPARPAMSDTLKAAIITGIFGVIVAVVTIVPNLLPKAAETLTPSPTTQAVIVPSNTPPPTATPTATDAPSVTPLPPTPTPLPTETPVTLSSTLALANTAVPPTPIIVTATLMPSATSVPFTATSTQSVKAYPCEANVVIAGSDAETIGGQVFSQPRTGATPLSIWLTKDELLTILQSRENSGTLWYQIARPSGSLLGWTTGRYLSLTSNCPPK